MHIVNFQRLQKHEQMWIAYHPHPLPKMGEARPDGQWWWW